MDYQRILSKLSDKLGHLRVDELNLKIIKNFLRDRKTGTIGGNKVAYTRAYLAWVEGKYPHNSAPYTWMINFKIIEFMFPDFCRNIDVLFIISFPTELPHLFE